MDIHSIGAYGMAEPSSLGSAPKIMQEDKRLQKRCHPQPLRTSINFAIDQRLNM